ncbi:MAG: enoyl-CoA hydratase/isomerase family protein [Gammaproteobacteria bacterium]|nr:enoyl-CoA hydratase/isomerase family protein [Gammaproteobacteria bacterium]MBU1645005.1 enoyl-CoA hydratase/isomerase family protein [Gammaproteobacteria bacterium]
MSPYQNLLTEIDRGVGIITLGRPDRHNAFDDVTIVEMIHALGVLETDSAVRVIVISSTGKSFSAGADLNWMQRVAGYDADENLRDARALAEMLRRIAQCSKPVIARVQGAAYGGGVGVIAACDIAIATFDAQFALTEVKLGIIPSAISPHVIAAIGERHARRYMLTAERFSASEAYRLGLVHEIVHDELALDDAIGDLIESLLKNGPDAMAECKQLIGAVASRPLSEELIEETAQRIARVRATPEAQEGMAAFLAKRKPSWVGE